MELNERGYWNQEKTGTSNPWRERLRQRAVSRRTLIVASGQLGAAAAGLAMLGCGGGKSEGKQTNSVVAKPTDTTSKAKAGGTFPNAISAEPPSLDALGAPLLATLSYAAHYTYPRLLKWTATKYPAPFVNDVEGDLAESFEYSPDKLQLTLHLRKGLKWDSRAPTSGREIDAADVQYSTDKFSKLHNQRADLFAVTPTATGPIETVTAPDKNTIVFKLKKPDTTLLVNLASGPLLFIMPREAESAFDPKKDVRGYGPYLLESYNPSSSITWRRNPDYYVKGRPFIDKIERFTLPEYATRLSQFKAGSIWTSDVRQEDILATKDDTPALVLSQGTQYTTFGRMFLLPFNPGSPFLDERVRQAFSLMLDREQIIDVFTNRQKFKASGLEVQARYDTSVGAGEPYWLDPQDAGKFGPNSKYFTFDLVEAKKLMAAAGYANGFDIDYTFPTDQGGADFVNHASIVSDMLRAGGIRTALRGITYSPGFFPDLYLAYAVGNYAKTGVGRPSIINWSASARGTAGAILQYHYHKDGTRFFGAAAPGIAPDQGDPFVNDTIVKMLLEFDRNKEWEMAKQLQQYLAGKAYVPPAVGPGPNFLGFGLNWPALQNYGLYLTTNSANAVAPVETNIHYWADESQRPIAKS